MCFTGFVPFALSRWSTLEISSLEVRVDEMAKITCSCCVAPFQK